MKIKKISFCSFLIFLLCTGAFGASKSKASKRSRSSPVGICPFDAAKATLSAEVRLGAEEIFKDLENHYGPCESFGWEGKGALLLRHRHGLVPMQVKMSGNTIRSFTLKATRFPHDSVEKIKSHAEALGLGLLWLSPQGTVVAALKENDLFSIGDSRRLMIGSALYDEIAKGKFSLSSVLPISFESAVTGPGFVKDWPPGLFVTVDSLWTLYMQERDAGAGDELVRIVGRKHPMLKTQGPFLYWREYTLLSRATKYEIDSYLKSPESFLENKLSKNKDRTSLPATQAPANFSQVGWHASLVDLCRALSFLPNDSRLSLASYFSPGTEGVISASPGMAQVTLRAQGVSCFALSSMGPEMHQSALVSELAKRVLAISAQSPGVDTR